MREILFRGKRLDNGEWIKGYYAEVDPLDIRSRKRKNIHVILPVPTTCKWSNKYFYSVLEILPETLGQYTGVKDANGTMIFEGDIIQVTHFTRTKKYLVNFSLDRGGWFPFANGDGCGCCEEDTEAPSGDGIAFDAEVIGNIHDNPELLGEVIKE